MDERKARNIKKCGNQAREYEEHFVLRLGTENPTENGLTVTSQRDRDACDATGHVRFWFSTSWKNERE